jgi:hypothetical protein
MGNCFLADADVTLFLWDLLSQYWWVLISPCCSFLVLHGQKPGCEGFLAVGSMTTNATELLWSGHHGKCPQDPSPASPQPAHRGHLKSHLSKVPMASAVFQRTGCQHCLSSLLPASMELSWNLWKNQRLRACFEIARASDLWPPEQELARS